MEYKDTVKGFDLKRYLGKWHEIARFDYRFERNLEACTAEYSIRADGLVKVVNSGHKNSPTGTLKTANGKAKLGAPDDPSKPGFLKVSFFWCFYSPYYILALDPDYQYALVAGKNQKYLWILSRTPNLSPATTQMLIDEAKQRGFETSRLLFVKQ